MFPMTKTDIAKLAASMVVAGKVTQITENQIAEHTSLDSDSTTVHVGATVVGQLVAYKLRPVTDEIVDTVIARYQSYKQKKQNKNAE